MIIMNNIKILDCTLRDGGYINDFNFGHSVIKSVIKKLSEASIDIVECGFLRSGEFNPDKTLFSNVETIKNILGEKNSSTMYIAMVQYGKITADEISPYNGSSIDGIRVSFHENEIAPALVLVQELIDRDYKIFLQVVGTTAYSDTELLSLIEKVNLLNPFCLYIVDTLGMMYTEDLLRFFYLINHNLSKNIALGFHSHNNLQMSFTNAQALIREHFSRDLIIDGSILGMGRGAGNLNIELLARFMNLTYCTNYDEFKLMEIMDEYILPIRKNYQWGYDIAYYVAAITGCHPNYAKFLLDKKVFQVRDMYNILRKLDPKKRHLFNQLYIEQKCSTIHIDS